MSRNQAERLRPKRGRGQIDRIKRMIFPSPIRAVYVCEVQGDVISPVLKSAGFCTLSCRIVSFVLLQIGPARIFIN